MKTEWTPVSERLPEFAVKVLISALYSSGMVVKLAERQPCNPRTDYWNWYDGMWIGPERVTHWMPLPDPPGPSRVAEEEKEP